MDDAQIERLILEPKRILQSGRWSTSLGHKRKDYSIVSIDGANQYALFVRQNLRLLSAFSCGLIWAPKSPESLTLTRYNGCEHFHGNPIEGDSFGNQFHIHKATERYILLGRKAEHYAEITTRYSDLNGALLCLLTDCNIEHHDDSNPTPDLLD